jgi:hypothetical protein
MDRRAFLKNLMRISILSGLTIISAKVMFPEQKCEKDKCEYNFVCNNCNKLEKCNLPEAVNLKISQKNGK